MNKSQNNQPNERARDAEGRFESQNQSKQHAGRSSQQNQQKSGNKMDRKNSK